MQQKDVKRPQIEMDSNTVPMCNSSKTEFLLKNTRKFKSFLAGNTLLSTRKLNRPMLYPSHNEGPRSLHFLTYGLSISISI
jgi:hypothetical protein